MTITVNEMLDLLSNEDNGYTEDNEGYTPILEKEVIKENAIDDTLDAVTELGKDINNVNQQTETLDKLNQVSASLENNLLLLDELDSKGIELSNMAAKQYMKSLVVAMESRGLPKHLYEDEVMSLEISLEQKDTDNKDVAIYKTKGIIERIKDFIRTIIERIVALARRLKALVIGNSKQVASMIKHMEKIAPKAKGETIGKLKVNDYPYLALSGTVDPLSMLLSMLKGVQTLEKFVYGIISTQTHYLTESFNALYELNESTTPIPQDEIDRRMKAVTDKHPLPTGEIQLTPNFKLYEKEGLYLTEFKPLDAKNVETSPLTSDEIKMSATRMKELLNSPRLASLTASPEAISKNFDSATKGLSRVAAHGSFGSKMVDDPYNDKKKITTRTNRHIQDTLNRINKATTSINTIAREVHSYINKVYIETYKASVASVNMYTGVKYEHTEEYLKQQAEQNKIIDKEIEEEDRAREEAANRRAGVIGNLSNRFSTLFKRK